MSSLLEPLKFGRSLSDFPNPLHNNQNPINTSSFAGVSSKRSYSFSGSTQPSNVKDMMDSCKLQQALTPQAATKPTVTVSAHPVNENSISDNSTSKKMESEEDVSEEFVTHFNTHIGNFENQDKAQRLIEKMRRLGGLMVPDDKRNIDIPAARLGLSILAGLNNPKYKLQALDNLLLLLQNDHLEKDTSINLVTLAINLMTKMNRVLMQTETIDVQIKIAQAYSLVAELLQRHYSKKHINAITKELKLELTATIKALEALNTQEDFQLDFYVSQALEGVRRLIDDRKELFDIIERFYHAAAAILSFERYDAATCFLELSNAFKDLDPHLPQAWYNGVLILNDLAKAARKDEDKLTGIQVLVREKSKKFNWKFTYAALGVLYDLTLHGDNKTIRKLAFNGVKVLGPDFPGFITFVNSKDLPKYLYLDPIIHLKKPTRKDPNIEIRFAAIEYLIKIAKESPDWLIKKKAKLVLIFRKRLEKDQAILDLINAIVPASKDEQLKWIGEEENRILRIHDNKPRTAPKIVKDASAVRFHPYKNMHE